MNSYATIRHRAQAEIIEKKSRFIASLMHVESEEEALAFLEEIRSQNRMARHNVYAYVLRDSSQTGRARYSDDGEPQKTAGLPTLEAITHAGLTDVCCVVTRYFGGVLLGTGGLVRAYTQATQAAIQQAEIVTVSLCTDMYLTCPYPLYEQTARLLEDLGAKIIDVEWTDVVTLTIRVLTGTEQPVIDALVELYRGEPDLLIDDPHEAEF